METWAKVYHVGIEQSSTDEDWTLLREEKGRQESESSKGRKGIIRSRENDQLGERSTSDQEQGENGERLTSCQKKKGEHGFGDPGGTPPLNMQDMYSINSSSGIKLSEGYRDAKQVSKEERGERLW